MGSAHSPLNIISIAHFIFEVNRICLFVKEICNLHKHILCVLYNFPS